MKKSPIPRPLAIPVFLSALGFIVFAGPVAANHLEAQMYAINDFAASGNCQGADRCWTSMIDDWYDEMDDHGWYHKDRRAVGAFIFNLFPLNFTLFDPGLFADPDQEVGGTDFNTIDEADAAFIATHGFDLGGHWGGLMRSQNGDENCFLDAPEGASGEFYVGDHDLEFLHLSSCNSIDDDNLGNTWRMFEDPADSPGNGRRLHQLNGFHGIMWINCDWGFRYEDFAADGFAVSIKDAWLSNMYVASVSFDSDNDGVNEQYEQCPVAYSVGTNSFDECVARLQTEQYDQIQSDPGPINYICAYAFEGCTPLWENPFSF
jgi:hypothetical protein